jgi:hypothetical protein
VKINRHPRGVGGWLLVLCVWLLAWQPVSLGLVASSALDALPLRGLPLGVILLVRLVTAAFGVAAGIALFARRPAAVTMARASLLLSAGIDTLVYTTPYFPSNRVPGDTPIYVLGALTFYGAWMVYLFRSKRVKHTYG